MPKRHSVVITGIGLVTPVGRDTAETWDSVVQGKPSFARYDIDKNRSCVVGLVGDISSQLSSVLSPKIQDQTDRFIHLAVLAGSQALTDAGLAKENIVSRERFGVCVGVGIGGLATIGDAYQFYAQQGSRAVSPFTIPKAINNMAAGWLSMLFDLRGCSLALTSACSSSADALGYALRMIRDGYADRMLVGGSEACVVPVALAGFANMRALSTWDGDPNCASRPFDKKRTGFVMSEGAGMLVLEREDHARARGAPIYAQLCGYGVSADAHHITAMHPDGRGAIQAINNALADARLTADDIDYINAHGTGTVMNDKVETAVIRSVFSSRTSKDSDHLLVSSTKSVTGHLLGAAGGVEAALTALSLHHQLVPPTINLNYPDPDCNLDYVAEFARCHSMRYALSQSFGFGGANSVLVLGRC